MLNTTTQIPPPQLKIKLKSDKTCSACKKKYAYPFIHLCERQYNLEAYRGDHE